MTRQPVMMSNLALYKELLHKAVQLLAQRNHSAYELKNKLFTFYQKKYSNEELESDFIYSVINSVLEECSAKKWLNEDDYVEQYIAMRARKGYGKNRIILELKQRGIDNAASLAIMSKQNIDWIDIGVHQVIKKFRSIAPKDLQQKSKIMLFLAYKGFSQEQIKLIYSAI